MDRKKKIIIGVAAAAAIVYFATRKKTGTKTDTKTDVSNIIPTPAKDNSTPRVLTDAEALSYLNNNQDLIAYYGAGNIEGAKGHFLNQGYKENRPM